MIITDEQVKDVIKRIKRVKEYKGLCSYTEKMLDYFKDSVTMYTGYKVVANKYGEELTIYVNTNSFNITIPSWNSTDISKFKYIKVNDLSIFNYQRNIKFHEANDCWNYHYVYQNDKLIYVDGINNVTFDNPKYKSRNKCEQTCFYIINRKKILKKVITNNTISYYIIDLDHKFNPKKVNFENMNFNDFNRLYGILVSDEKLIDNRDSIDKKIKILKNKLEV